MRLVLTGLLFIASLAAAVFVHAARADAAWERPQQIDAGHSPHVRPAGDGGLFLAYAQGDGYDPSRLLVSTGNEPVARVKVARAGRVVAFDADARGRLVALRARRASARPSGCPGSPAAAARR